MSRMHIQSELVKLQHHDIRDCKNPKIFRQTQHPQRLAEFSVEFSAPKKIGSTVNTFKPTLFFTTELYQYISHWMYPGVDQQNRGNFRLCLGSNSIATSIRALRFERWTSSADGLLVTENVGKQRIWRLDLCILKIQSLRGSKIDFYGYMSQKSRKKALIGEFEDLLGKFFGPNKMYRCAHISHTFIG